MDLITGNLARVIYFCLLYVLFRHVYLAYCICFSSPLSFSFQNFFLHGESTVCVSVDVERRTQLYRLTPNQLKVAKDGIGSNPGMYSLFIKLLVTNFRIYDRLSVQLSFLTE